MGLEFQIQGDKVCYTPLKDKCDAIRNLESPKTLRQTRAFCGMVNFLSSFLPSLCRLLIPIYDLQKKAKKFKWTEEAEKAFNEIKKLLINPPVLKHLHLMDYSDSKVIPQEKVWVALYYKSKEMNR